MTQPVQEKAPSAAYRRAAYIAAFSNGACESFNKRSNTRLALATVAATALTSVIAPPLTLTVAGAGMSAFVAKASISVLSIFWGVLQGDPEIMTYAPQPDQKQHWSYRSGKWLVLGAQIAAVASAPYLMPPQSFKPDQSSAHSLPNAKAASLG